jgi:hemolysin III
MTAHKQLMDPMISSADSNEYFNVISHLIGAILSISGIALLIIFAAIDQKWLHLITFSIYGITLLASFVASCLLHS